MSQVRSARLRRDCDSNRPVNALGVSSPGGFQPFLSIRLSYFSDTTEIWKKKDVIKALAALAQSNRLRVFRALVVTGKEGATPGALADANVSDKTDPAARY